MAVDVRPAKTNPLLCPILFMNFGSILKNKPRLQDTIFRGGCMTFLIEWPESVYGQNSLTITKMLTYPLWVKLNVLTDDVTIFIGLIYSNLYNY